MFDWDQYELENIIWGEFGESDDHIVPHPDSRDEKPSLDLGDFSKKQRHQVDTAIVNTAEHKTSVTKNDTHGSKMQTNPHMVPTEELSAPTLDMDSWSDLPISSAGRNGGDSMDAEVSNDFNGVTRLGSIDCDMIPGPLEKLCDFSGTDITQPDEDLGLFRNDQDDKEGGSLFDFGWASIGSFDDIDRIFQSSGTEDELWSSSAGAEMELMPCENNSVVIGCDKITSLRSSGDKEINEPSDRDEHSEDKRIPTLVEQPEYSTEMNEEITASKSQITSENSGTADSSTDKSSTQRKVSKCQKKVEEKRKAKSSLHPYGTCPTESQIQNFAPLKMQVPMPSALWVLPSPVLTAQRQLGGPESLRDMNTSNPYMHTGYGYRAYHVPTMPLLPDQSQQVPSGYKISPDSSKHLDHLKKHVPSRPLTMTPQEKIEKLRRRQKMRARLAVEHQQQKLDGEISCVGHSVTQNCNVVNQGQDAVTSNNEVEEEMIQLTEVDMKPLALQDSDNASVDDSLLEKIFAQLQDAIGKLDIKTRLRILDSLNRLARSAMKRHNVGDTSSSSNCSRDENDETNNDRKHADRSMKLPGAETDTNPIDRTVAHLLFYRPSNVHEVLFTTHGC